MYMKKYNYVMTDIKNMVNTKTDRDPKPREKCNYQKSGFFKKSS